MSPQKKGEAKPETIRSLFPAANNLGKKNWFSCTPRYTEMYFSGKGWERVARAPRTEELLLTPWPAASCVFVQPAHSATAPQPPCSSAPTTKQLDYYTLASPSTTCDWKSPDRLYSVKSCGAGEGRGILSIIYTIVTPRQNYQTSSSRGSLPYIHKTSVIMYFDLLFFFFPFLAHKELIKTHLTQSQSKTQIQGGMGTKNHPGKSHGTNPTSTSSKHPMLIIWKIFDGPSQTDSYAQAESCSQARPPPCPFSCAVPVWICSHLHPQPPAFNAHPTCSSSWKPIHVLAWAASASLYHPGELCFQLTIKQDAWQTRTAPTPTTPPLFQPQKWGYQLDKTWRI